MRLRARPETAETAQERKHSLTRGGQRDRELPGPASWAVLRMAAEGGLRLATPKCFESIESKSTRFPTGVRAMHKLRLRGRKVGGASPTQGAVPYSRQVWRNAEESE